MAEKSGFFNGVETSADVYDRVYDAEDFARYFATFIGNGVFVNPSDQLKVVPKTGLTVTVKAGKAFIDGYWYELDEDMDITLTANGTSSTINDVIACTLNKSNRTITTVKKESVSSTLPVNNGTTHELILAIVSVGVGVSSLTASNITDTRPDNTYCGYVGALIDQVDFGSLFDQMESQFMAWFEEMKDQLSEDAAGNLQSQITELQDGAYMMTLQKEITGSADLNAYTTPGNWYCKDSSNVLNCPTSRAFALKVETIVNKNDILAMQEGVRQILILPEGIELVRNSIFDDGNSNQKRWSPWYSSHCFWVVQLPITLNVGSNRFEYTKNTLGLKTLKDGNVHFIITDAMYYYGRSNNLNKFVDGSSPSGVSVVSIENNLNGIVYVTYNRNSLSAPNSIRPIFKVEVFIE